MLNKLQIIFLLLCFNFEQLRTKKIKQKNQSKNFLRNFNPDQVKDLSKKFQYIMIGYIDKKTKKGQQIKESLKLVSKEHKDQKDFFWIWIDYKKLSKEQKQNLDVYQKNEIHLYYQQHQKKYHGQTKAQNIYNWFLEITSASIQTKQSYKDLHTVDSHYFVYTTENYYKRNQQKLDILVKLIYPIQIVKGFDNQNFAKKFKREQNENELFIFREYKNQQINIENLNDILQIADYIEINEFPDTMIPNKQSLKLILDYKIPTAIYFTKNKKDKNIQEIQKLANQHKEYFLFMYVACNEKCDKYQKFFMKFMGIKERPALRIIQVKKKVNRFKFLGEFDKDLVEYFFSNYLNSHLKSYQINENLKKQKQVGGIKKINSKQLKQALKRFDQYTLIYVYSNLNQKKKVKKQLQVLKQIQDAYQVNDYFRIYAFDNDKNDFKGKRSDILPNLILKQRSNSLMAFNKEFTFENIQKFITENNKSIISKITDEL